MDSMFGLNCTGVLVHTSDELNNRCGNKKLRRNITQSSSVMSDHLTRKTNQVEGKGADDAVHLKLGHSKRIRDGKNHQFLNELEIRQRKVYQERDSCMEEGNHVCEFMTEQFLNELQMTQQKVYQERASCMEDGNHACGLMTDLRRWAEEGPESDVKGPESDVKGPESDVNKGETNVIEEPKLRSRKAGRRLERDFLKANRLLEIERSQKHALQGRLEDIENQLIHVRKSQGDEESWNRKYGHKMRTLQDEVKECRGELERERARANKMEEELEAARQENAKSQEQMRLLMFHHIPSVSPRFKDIGPVNYGIEEVSDRVGDYELGKVLGEGHYGMVQVGTNVKTGQNFAVKILSKDRVRRFKDLQQMALEVHVLKRYPHPNIVHLREVVHAPAHLYLATELCLMDIHQYHNGTGLSEEGAKHVILGILKPLEFLHSHGICHLDLKPENILISRSADVKNVTYEDIRLCDFGLVNMAKTPEKSKEVYRQGYACGTPGFFAPEMILKSEFEGRLADMWSLGCIILELTLGFTQQWIDSYELIDADPKAFQGGLEECLQEIAMDKYPLHQNLLDIIHSSLKIEPANRLKSRYALRHPWIASITMADENREDSGHSRQGSRSPNKYAERQELLCDSALYYC
jgi:serine/threonine protein kinase